MAFIAAKLMHPTVSRIKIFLIFTLGGGGCSHFFKSGVLRREGFSNLSVDLHRQLLVGSHDPDDRYEIFS